MQHVVRPAPPCCAKVIVEQMKALPESTRESWNDFVSGRLSEVNKRNMIVPASSYASAMHDSSEDDDAEFRNLQFPQEVALQQVSKVSSKQGGAKTRKNCCSNSKIVACRDGRFRILHESCMHFPG